MALTDIMPVVAGDFTVFLKSSLLFIFLAALVPFLRKKQPQTKVKATKSKTPSWEESLFLDQIVPYKGLPIHQRPEWPRYWKAGKWQMTMALRKLDPNNWMTFDDQWKVQHDAKLEMLKRPDKESIVDYLDGEDEAVTELLTLVVEYLTRKFPDMFEKQGDYVVIKPIAERHRIKAPFDLPPFEIIGLLTMDDLYILKKGERDLYYLRGAFLAAPTGWSLDERIGWPLHHIHKPVPMWKEKLQRSMERFFRNIKPEGAIQRNNLFIQPTGDIFHHDSWDDYPSVDTAEGIWIRTELQSLRRLPKSNAIVFSVRTYLTNLTELRDEPAALERLWDAVLNYPEIVQKYKVTGLWQQAFEQFCRETLGKERPEIDPQTGDGITNVAKTCPAGFS